MKWNGGGNMGTNGNLTDAVADSIIQLVIKNDLSPGDRLPTEFALAEKLGVGRSTVREAVRRLVSRNILEVRQGAGTFVSRKMGVPEDPLGLTFLSRNPKLAMELSDIRLMLEPEMAAMAARNAGEEQLVRLMERCRAVEESISAGGDYSEADIAFHNYIAECSGNSVLRNLIHIIVSGVRLAIITTEDVYRGLTGQEHRRIAEAIRRRDGNGARYAMIHHLNTSREHFVQQLSEDWRAPEKETNSWDDVL
jgi:DNA-binding FadR family transcriptional regulator